MKGKRGLSSVVSVVIITALVVAAIAIVWSFVENTITDRIDETTSCYDTMGELSFDNDYTCYNITSDDSEIRFKIDRGDINIEGVLISVKTEAETRSYKLTSEARDVSGLTNYPEREGTVLLPGKSEGETFIIENFPLNTSLNQETGLRLLAYPITGGGQCDNPSDSIKNVYSCSVFN